MVDITSAVVKITNKRVKELAEQIRDEMKAEIAGHVKTGKAYDSIRISYNDPSGGGNFSVGAGGSMRGGFLTYVFIGSNELSAYYLDNGNGGRRRKIRPTHAKALRLEDGGGGTIGYAKFVHGYKGIHFAKKVADRHR